MAPRVQQKQESRSKVLENVLQNGVGAFVVAVSQVHAKVLHQGHAKAVECFQVKGVWLVPESFALGYCSVGFPMLVGERAIGVSADRQSVFVVFDDRHHCGWSRVFVPPHCCSGHYSSARRTSRTLPKRGSSRAGVCIVCPGPGHRGRRTLPHTIASAWQCRA
jgi:hypothetical protein